ncbi:transcriptional regulator domain protein, partial [Vibrio parahaemolyticus EKP-028]
GSEPTY